MTGETGPPVTASIIVAASANEVIGTGGKLPWYLPADLRRFRALTTGHPVVMGRVTYASILRRLGHPLPGRTSVVVSTTLPEQGHEHVLVAGTVASALAAAAGICARAGDVEFFVAGGESVYRQVLPSVDRVYLTRVHAEFAGDRYMPDGWLAPFKLVREEHAADQASGIEYSWLDYQRAAT